MARSHLIALQKKVRQLEKKIHDESVHAARDEQMIRNLKKERLHVEEEIGRLQEAG